MTMKSELWAAWRDVESTYLPSPSYFAYQLLEKHHRSVLVNWAMEMASELELGRQTFEVAVNIFDRFFSCTKYVPKDLIQVLMTASLWIAAKKEVHHHFLLYFGNICRKLILQSWARCLKLLKHQT
jgi:hypothetical protein